MAENMLQLNCDETHILTLGTKERLALPGNKVSVSMDGILLEEDASHRETLLGITVLISSGMVKLKTSWRS